MKREFSYLSADAKTDIHAICWEPADEPKAVLQIAHGMVEFIDRYCAFAEFLTEKGFVVTGNDHLGHGASVVNDEDHGFFAEENGNECVIRDIQKLREITSEKYPGVPYFLMGHSMGSFLVRQYITLHAEGLSGCIIMGTGSQPSGVLAMGKLMAKIIAGAKGWRHRSKFIDNMAFGSYNKKFEPSRTSKDWLSRDEKAVDAYIANPWCSFMFTVNGYYNMFLGIEACQNKAAMANIPKELPLLLTSGTDDPLSAGGKAIQSIAEGYRASGIKDISVSLYQEYRHEILNEIGKEQVYADILSWLESKL